MKNPVLLILGACLLTSLCTPAFSEKPLRFFFEKTATKEAAPLPSYTVRPGDWLYKILLKQGYSQAEISQLVPAIQEINPHIADVNALRPGQTLYLPPRAASAAPPSASPQQKRQPTPTLLQKPYVVRPGDTLTNVLQQQGIPHALIYSKYIPRFQQLNPAVNSTNSLRSGQQIVLPLVDPADLGLDGPTAHNGTGGDISPLSADTVSSRPAVMNAMLRLPPRDPLNATLPVNSTAERPVPSSPPQFTVTNSTSAARKPTTGLQYVRTILTQMRFSFASGDEEMYPTPGNEWLHVNLNETPLVTTPWGAKALLCPIPKSAGWITKATALGMQVCSVPADWNLSATLNALARTFADSMRIWEPGRELSLSRNAMGLTVSAPHICIVQRSDHKIVHIVWSRLNEQERPLPQDLPDVLRALDVSVIELDQFNAPSRLPATARQSVYIPEATPLDILRAIRLDNAEQILGPTPPATLGALLQILRSKEMLLQSFATVLWTGGADRRLSLHIPAWHVGPRERKVILIDQRFGEAPLVSLLAQEGYSCFVLPQSF